MKRPAVALAIGLLAAPVWAVEPDEVLEDPALEARARQLSTGLRCVVCRNESIDESQAELARDLRLLVRARLVEGDSDEEAIAYLVDRYGEYVLLAPTRDGSNLLLWGAPLALLLLGGGIAGAHVARQRKAEAVPALDAAEEARLRELLGDGERGPGGTA